MKNALEGLPLRLYPIGSHQPTPKPKPKKPDGRRVTSGSVFPYRLTNAAKARVIAMFEADGQSVHSPRGMMLGVIIEHCINNDIHFKLCRGYGGMYSIEKIVLEDVTCL